MIRKGHLLLFRGIDLDELNCLPIFDQCDGGVIDGIDLWLLRNDDVEIVNIDHHVRLASLHSGNDVFDL